MAMKKRRKSRLSGSPEYHRNESLVARDKARQFASESIANSEGRNCEAAFESLVDAVEASGVAEAHEASGASRQPSSRHSSDAAESAFYEACVIREPLAGLRRRKTSRRKRK